MRSNKVVSIFLALAIMLSFAACSSGDERQSTTGSPDKGSSPSVDTETVSPSNDVTDEERSVQTQIADGAAVMWINSGFEGEEIIKILDQDWNTNQDFKITAMIQPGSADDYFQKLTVAFASESGPDIFAMSANEIVKYVDSGIAYDMSQWILPNKDDYYDNCINAVIFDGKVMATPSNMDLLALYYNKELFEQEGLQAPETWEETIEIAKQLTTDDRYGIMIDTMQSGYANFEFYPFIWMCGGDLLSKDHKSVAVDEATEKALGFYRDLINSGGASKSIPTETFDTTLLATGKVAMQFCGSWAVAELAASYPDFNYDIAPYPVPEKGIQSSSDAGGWRFMVSSKGENPSECAGFLDWLLNKDTKYPAQICKASSKFSPRKSVTEAAGDYYNQFPLNKFTEEILPVAGMEPAYTNEQVKIFGDALQDAMFTSRPISDITDELRVSLEKTLN